MDLDKYNVYVCKDGRTRAYHKETHAIVSYPKLLMENILGRPLKPNEDVHHKDGNPLNNNPWNLAVIDHSEHSREHAQKSGKHVKQNPVKKDFEHKGRSKKYFDVENVCPVCNSTFIWTAEKQRCYFSHKKTTEPCCSRKCSYIFFNDKEYFERLDELQQLLFENKGNFTVVSKILGITDNAIKHRLQKANLPYKSGDYKNKPF